ncbi:hypothetical protein AB0C15_12480 [Micromonospora sp. NPDC048835]|uniref:hypothetical protein n=1 Tax=Micromonospora sp. NPDC048835 TaxID=3155147 RepID=UPI0033D13B2C
MGVVTIGGAAGVGSYALPLPLTIAITGAIAVVVGFVMIRMTFRRQQSVGQ